MEYKDKRYIRAGELVRAGIFTKFREIFEVIAKSRLCADMGLNSARMNKFSNNVEKFRIEQLFFMASLLEISIPEIWKIIYNQYLDDESHKDLFQNMRNNI